MWMPGGCSCALEGAGAVNVSGNGSASSPFVVSVDLEELIQAGPGITFDPASGTISINLSLDGGNAATFGSDNGLFVFSGGGDPIALCTEYFTTNDEGDICLKPGTMGLREVVTYGTPGTYQFDPAAYPWLARVRAKVQAGGGGSAGAAAAANQSIWRAGGAGGGYGEGLYEVAALGGPVTVTVGAGGAAAGAVNGGGGAGGNSSFGALLNALGGAGSPASMPSGSTGTTATGTAGPAAGSGGYYNSGGGSGTGAIRLTGSAGIGGAGGESHLGHGGASRSTAGVGIVPRGFGGGAGGSNSANGVAQAGRAGGGGIVILELYG